MQKVIFLVVVILFLCCCKRELIQNIDEARAHRVITELYALDMEAQKVKQADGAWTIRVEERDLTRAIAVLSNRKLMPEAMTEEIKPGLMDSKEEHQYAYQRKLSLSLEKTLETFPHILRARVHIHLPPAIDTIMAFSQSELREGKEPASAPGSASVLLLSDEKVEVTQEQVAAIISGASGISPESVVVIFERIPALKSELIVLEKSNDAAVKEITAIEKGDSLPTNAPQGSLRSSKTLLWGTTAYLAGIISLLGAATVLFLRRNRAVNIGHKILYEGK